VPMDTAQSARILALRLDIARQFLPADDPFIREAFRPGETPAQAARRLTSETRIADPAFRQELLEGGAPAVAASTDPMVRLARQMEDAFARLRPQWDEVLAAERVQSARLGRALFAAYGTQLPPDATFTLRITDGVVARYPYNGTVAPPHTSIYGLYARASEFNNEMPWTLPETFAERRDAVDMSTPLNFVTTNDITGGNSGSPMIDREARVVGLVFDSNIEGLPYVFLYGTPESGRAVGVHSAGILESLRNVYRADALVRELTARCPPRAAPPPAPRTIEPHGTTDNRNERRPRPHRREPRSLPRRAVRGPPHPEHQRAQRAPARHAARRRVARRPHARGRPRGCHR